MEVNKEKEVTIGIELGLTSSCVAVWRYGRAEVIPNDMGNLTTPSYVAFTDTHCFVGEAAKNQADTNPANTIFDSMRLLGRSFDDEEVQRFIKLWPFKVIPRIGSSDDKKPMIVVSYKGKTKEFQAEEISAIILIKLKEIAEAYLGTKVKNVVISVPASFNYLQRKASKDAGVIAGLNVMQVIDKPTVAVMAYSIGKYFKKVGHGKGNVLVFDLSKETCEISLINIENKVFEVKSTCEDDSLGGRNFESRLVNYFVNDFQRKHGKNICGNARAMNRLRNACQKARIELSSASETTVMIDSLFDGIDYRSSLNHALFKKLNYNLLECYASLIDKCLKDAKMGKADVHEVVLVGGDSIIPMIQQMLENFFGRVLCSSIHPDEVVACGAAVHAEAISSTRPMTTNVPSILKDVDSLLKEFGSEPAESFPSHIKAEIVEMLKKLKLDYSNTELVQNLSFRLRLLEISLPEHLRPALSGLEQTLVACQSRFLKMAAEKGATVVIPTSINVDLTTSKKKIQTTSSDCDKLKSDIADIDAKIARLMDHRASLKKDLDTAQLRLIDLTASLATQMESAKKRHNQVTSFQNAGKSLGLAVDCLIGFLTSV